MALQDAQGRETRPPTIDDLVNVGRELNKEKVKYVLIGDFAMNYYGFPRGTEDIDLLVDPSEENILKIKKALSFLPDNAVKEIDPDDIEKADISTLISTKQGMRPRDKEDLAFLQSILKDKKKLTYFNQYNLYIHYICPRGTSD